MPCELRRNQKCQTIYIFLPRLNLLLQDKSNYLVIYHLEKTNEMNFRNPSICILTFWYIDVSILVWSNLVCMEDTRGLLALLVDGCTACFSPRANGESAFSAGTTICWTANGDTLMPSGVLGVPGAESSVKIYESLTQKK